MKIKIFIILSFSLFFILASSPGQFVKVSGENTNNKSLATPTPTPCPTSVSKQFFSYSQCFPPDASVKNPFELRQDYPKDKPKTEELPWTKIVKKKEDFKDNWQKYLYAILEYGYDGNLEKNWVVKENKKRNWFHAPYMDAEGVGIDIKTGNDTFRKMGREYIHGLTQERSTCPEELKGERSCLSSSPRFQNWAVSFYNAPGGYYIGQVWRELFRNLDTTEPISNPNPANIWKKLPEGFPEGTVVIKLLFTEANDDMLAGSIVWNANINVPNSKPERRETKPMRLMQIDVAVRDNISPTGWVFGTFVFQRGSATPISYPKDVHKGWLKFVPIGLMYGNNKGESFNESKENLPYNQHQGCDQYLNPKSGLLEKDDNGEVRTNGPIDNPNSSCIACHAAAETNSLDKFIFTNLDRKYPNLCSDRVSHKFWFKNVNPRNPTEQTLEPNVASLDYSLQLRNGIDRCCRDGRFKKNQGCLCENQVNKKFDGEMTR